MKKLKLAALSFAATIAWGGCSANAAVVQIGSMTTPNVVIDFSTFATGATSVAAINAAAPGAGITSITFAEGTPGFPAFYDSFLGSGNALAADGAGGLTVVPEFGGFGNADSMTIVLDHMATEFGFQMADHGGPTLTFFDGPVAVGSIVTSSFVVPPVTEFFRSDVAFDTIVISQGFNWVIPELVIQTAVAEIPEAAALGLFGLGLAGLGLAARRRTEMS